MRRREKNWEMNTEGEACVELTESERHNFVSPQHVLSRPYLAKLWRRGYGVSGLSRWLCSRVENLRPGRCVRGSGAFSLPSEGALEAWIQPGSARDLGAAATRAAPLHQRDLHLLPPLHLPARLLLGGWRGSPDGSNGACSSIRWVPGGLVGALSWTL